MTTDDIIEPIEVEEDIEAEEYEWEEGHYDDEELQLLIAEMPRGW